MQKFMVSQIQGFVTGNFHVRGTWEEALKTARGQHELRAESEVAITNQPCSFTEHGEFPHVVLVAEIAVPDSDQFWSLQTEVQPLNEDDDVLLPSDYTLEHGKDGVIEVSFTLDYTPCNFEQYEMRELSCARVTARWFDCGVCKFECSDRGPGDDTGAETYQMYQRIADKLVRITQAYAEGSF